MLPSSQQSRVQGDIYLPSHGRGGAWLRGGANQQQPPALTSSVVVSSRFQKTSEISADSTVFVPFFIEKETLEGENLIYMYILINI